jgi:hypothetical protein
MNGTLRHVTACLYVDSNVKVNGKKVKMSLSMP